MIQILKNFTIVLIIFVGMLIGVYKPYKEEVVSLDEFTEYYSEEGTLEEGGGFELIKDNFYIIEREYNLKSEIDSNQVLPELPDTAIEKKKESSIEKPEKKIYKVVSGDTIGKIASKFNISQSILRANNPNISDSLKIGQKLNIVTENGIFYKVKSGDSLFKIANRYGVNSNDVRKINSLKTDILKVGQELFIKNPSEKSLVTTKYKKAVTSSNGFLMPVKWAGVTSSFGNRMHPVLKRYIYHAGVDLRAKYVPLMASRSGTVTYVGYINGYGKIIKINHGNGYETRSAHLEKIYVKKGQKVKAGQVIGKTGMSGRVTGPHLHFEIRKNGKALDPMKYLKK